MALPLPRVVADVGPGGPLVTAMGGMNALSNANHLRKINQVKAQWAPVTTQAEAASKLAYASMMGPQFMAKLLANPGFMGNLSEEQRQFVKNFVYKGGTQSPANSLLDNTGAPTGNEPPPYSGVGQPSTNNASGGFVNALKDYFGITPKKPMTNPIMKTPAETAREGRVGYNETNNAKANEAPAASYDEGTPGIDAAWDAWGKTPEGQREYHKENPNLPSDEWVLAWNKARLAGQPIAGRPMEIEVRKAQTTKEPSYAENEAAFKATVAEGPEAGKQRIKQAGELDDQHQQALEAEVPLQHLTGIVTNPVFQNLRSSGALQKLQLDAKEITGSDEEKKLISDFQTTALTALRESIMGWKGRILDKEVGISSSMKIGPKDSIQAILGKMPTMLTFNEITKQRARIAAKIIRDDHLSKGDALEKADKLVNKVAIRKQMEKALRIKEAPITSEDIDHTAKEKGMTREKVIERLKAEGRYNG